LPVFLTGFFVWRNNGLCDSTFETGGF